MDSFPWDAVAKISIINEYECIFFDDIVAKVNWCFDVESSLSIICDYIFLVKGHQYSVTSSMAAYSWWTKRRSWSALRQPFAHHTHTHTHTHIHTSHCVLCVCASELLSFPQRAKKGFHFSPCVLQDGESGQQQRWKARHKEMDKIKASFFNV